ncbi:MAG TPA: c-type cytochrome [Anaerolineales bacterium]|nr:c-type cytochrome [Anaerolineales bacterium]
MSTSLSVIIQRLFMIFVAAGLAFAVILLFTFDIIKIDWPSFMEIQPSYRQMENPLPVPERSIPIEGPIVIPGMGAPENPTKADDASIARGAELYNINCKMCHGQTAQGNGPIAAFLANKPANLTSPVVQSKSDGSIFLTITNGVAGKMPALNENFLVPERWDLVNYVRTLKAKE